MARIVVVGAGVGGLATAARLAVTGHQVTVLEQADTVGGKLGRHTRDTEAGPFHFDTGPSLLTLPEVFHELFEATGAKLDEYLDLVPLDPIVRHVFDDGAAVLDSCAEPAEFTARIGAALGDRAAADWQRLWRRAARVWRASEHDILRRRVDSPRDLARLAWRLGDLAAIRPGQSLRGLGRSHLSDPRLRMLLDRYATYTGADPRRAPAALVAVPYAELTFGGWYLRGGLGTLADALLSRCLDLGVVVRTGTTVTRIDATGGRVHGVRIADQRAPIPADVVVANVDALTVYRDLLPDARRLAGLTDRSLAGFVLLLGVRGESGLAHHNVFFPRDYDAEFDAVFGDPGRGVRARPAADPTIFVTVADDPTVRPDGHEAWFVLVNAARQGTAPGAVDWRRPGLAQAYADRILDVLAERGVDVRDRLVFRDIRTPADLATATGAPGGTIYGTAGGLLRPANRGPARGLWLVGGSGHPGGGLPMVTLSAQIVADAVGPAW
ncbi:phytoene desaturase [Micromonospora fiedleri]|uniref:Phytoene desaturase n=1 Tax=Micromonospora fiedleri TaxID=1157498 RepID=A0ABS1UHC0_9ACTN|nr:MULTISPECIES: phytoene desaturase family protein [Micromonospora]MBL6275718.1 phytoene desaturase [Micromonospora fiedleri]WSK41833.1 phytoene desaturase family protein [Micromonospora maris]